MTAQLRRRLLALFSQALKKSVEAIKASEAVNKNVRIRHSSFGPSLQDSVNPDTLGALKLGILEIGVMDHLADLPHHFVSNVETSCQRFERAIVALMRELRFDHVIRNAI